MDNETKYPLIIIGVALIALVAFNYDNFYTGGTILRNDPTTFTQERLVLVRDLDVPSTVNRGSILMNLLKAIEEKIKSQPLFHYYI